MKTIHLVFAFSFMAMPIFAQEHAVSALAFNVLYVGVDNPVNVVVENYDCDSILVSSQGRLIKTRPCQYVVKPIRTGNLRFSIKGISKGDTIRLGNSEFRVLNLPDPVAIVDRHRSESLSLSELVRSRGIHAELNDFIFDVEFEIESYHVVIERNDARLFEKEYEGGKFPNELKTQFQEMYSGDIVRFEKLVAVGPDSIAHEVAPVSYKVR